MSATMQEVAMAADPVRRPWVLVLVVVLAAVLLLAEDSSATVVTAPIGNDQSGGFVSEGFFDLEPGAVVSATIYGTFTGRRTATVTAARIVRVPGTLIPELVHVARLIGRGSGGSHGWPVHDPDFQLAPLFGVPLHPTRYFSVQVGYRVGSRRGLYAIAGLELDYTIDGRPYRSTMYGALTACVRMRCDSAQEKVDFRIERMAGLR